MHYKYDHKYFSSLQDIATNGLLTNNLAYIPLPICTDCIYVKATKLSRKTETERFINESKLVASVGDFLFVDLLVSNTPGIITQIYEFITNKRYGYACVFVNHYVDFIYIHLLMYQTGDIAFESKEA